MASKQPKSDGSASMEDIFKHHAYFNTTKGKVGIQLPSDQTKYAWHNMSRFNKAAQVLRDGPVKELPVELDDRIPNLAYKSPKGDETVMSHCENYPVDAVVVVKDGKVLFEYYNNMRPIDKHFWFSCTKIVGSTCFALLEHQGKVDKSKMVSEYLPELKGSAWDKIPVAAALDMTTGLNGTEHDEPEGELAGRMMPEKLWYQWAVANGVISGDSNQTPFEVLRKMEPAKEPFKAFEYNSINTWVMNRIVERLSDKPIPEMLSEHVWQKIGAEHDAHINVSDQGYTLGFYGMNCTARDMARFGMIFTPSCEQLCGEKVIPDAVLKEIQTGGKKDIYYQAWAGKKFGEAFPDDSLANHYQWDAVFDDGDIYKAGVGGQTLYISPARNMVVCTFCTSDGNNNENTMARAICKAVCPLPH